MEDLPPGLIEEFKAQTNPRINVLGKMAASLDIDFHDESARKPIGNLLNERVEVFLGEAAELLRQQAAHPDTRSLPTSTTPTLATSLQRPSRAWTRAQW